MASVKLVLKGVICTHLGSKGCVYRTIGYSPLPDGYAMLVMPCLCAWVRSWPDCRMCFVTSPYILFIYIRKLPLISPGLIYNLHKGVLHGLMTGGAYI